MDVRWARVRVVAGVDGDGTGRISMGTYTLLSPSTSDAALGSSRDSHHFG